MKFIHVFNEQFNCFFDVNFLFFCVTNDVMTHFEKLIYHYENDVLFFAFQ